MDPELGQLIYRAIVTSEPQMSGGEIVDVFADNIATLAKTGKLPKRPQSGSDPGPLEARAQ